MTDQRDIQTAAGDQRNVAPQQQPSRQAQAQDERTLLPRVDVLEDDGGITLLADLPGVPREQLDIRVEGETLTIEGRVATPMPEQLEPVHAEMRVPRYRRAFTLSRELDCARIQASLSDGVLNLRIPKQEHAQPRRIEVQAG